MWGELISSGAHHPVGVVHSNDQLLEEPAGQVLLQASPRPHEIRQVAPRRKLHAQHLNKARAQCSN